jgi:DNA helicase-2/ATP-dependent DNA helicase PcrA
LEEERRLFYVAITRAEERCFITYAKSRFKNGQVNFANPSRFIKDIDPAYLDQPADVQVKSKSSFFDDDDDFQGGFRNFGRRTQRSYTPKQSYQQPELPSMPPSSPKKLTKIRTSEHTVSEENFTPTIPVGKFVKHQLFGIGKVLSVSMTGANEKADIDFGEKGVKSLLLKFAKLELLE